MKSHIQTSHSTIFACVLCICGQISAQLISTVSPYLQITTEGFQKQVRAAQSYEIPIQSFSLKYKPEGPSSDNVFAMAMFLDKAILEYGSINCIPDSTTSFRFEESTSGLLKTTFEGSAEYLDFILKCLYFHRDRYVGEEKAFEVVYKISSIALGGSSTDILRTEVLFAPKISYEVLPKVNTMYVDPEKTFSIPLVRINESRIVQSGQEPRLDSTSSSQSFYSIVVKEDTVFVEGMAPAQFGTLEDPQPVARISFYLQDDKTGNVSESFTCFLQIDPKKVQAAEKLKLIFLTSVISTFIVVMFICVFLMLRREKKQQKEQVKQVIQEEVPQDNILTKSILEWNKGEVGTTRDQTGKDSVYFNPYEKDSLKKGGKGPKGAYSSLKVADGEKDHSLHDGSHSSRIIKHSDNGPSISRRIPTGSSGSNLRLNSETPSSPLSHKELPPEKLLKPAQPSVTQNFVAVHKGIGSAPITFTEREFKNLSQLEFSKIEDFNSNIDKKPKEMELFGDMSKIADNKTLILDDLKGAESADKNEQLHLEDIILKDLVNDNK